MASPPPPPQPPPPPLLEAYRRDRRRLLGYLLSAGGGGRAVNLAGVDLDSVSADYALECVASGEQFDPSEATRRYFEERRYPIMISSSSGNSYFFLSRPEVAGYPPKQRAPDIGVGATVKDKSSAMRQPDDLFKEDISASGTVIGTEAVSLTDNSSQQLNKMDIHSLGLPRLSTDLSDDDIRETAYEVLLASLFSRGKIQFSEEKKEKKPRLFKGLRSRREGLNSSPQPENYYSDLLDLIRVQMEISETMDALSKKALRHFCSKVMHEQIDVPYISLELLSSVSKFDFPTERLRAQWQRRQRNVLEELLLFSANHDHNMIETLRIVLSKLRNTEDWVVSVPDGRVEVLTVIERYCSKLSSTPKKFGLEGETNYWTHSYHFNLKLYERLLCSVFDILEDGQLIEEADEILEAIKLTWPILGITQKLHDIFYAWVLFQKFAQTGEIALLKHTHLQMQKLRLNSNVEETELYINSLICSIESCDSKTSLNVVDSALLKIHTWCRRQLEDYHAYFGQRDKYPTFRSVVNLLLLSAANPADEDAAAMLIGPMTGSAPEFKLIHVLVERSIQAAYKHELVLEGTTSHSENLKEILAASYNFELCLAQKLYSMYREAVGSSMSNYLKPYKISYFSGPILLQWLHAQHQNILEWTKRTIEIEDWEPLSAQQRQATSVVEVFRIVQETIDQFFNSNLPMDTAHLRCLLIGIASSLEVYLLHMENQQVARASLLPCPPVLTRYTESMNPFTKKKLIEPTVPEEKVTCRLNNLAVPKLCVKLNTLHYIRDELDTIEEGIKQSWRSILSAMSLSDYLSCTANGRTFSKNSSAFDESIDELFTIFDDVRRTAINTTAMILDFIGARIIFWDMRDSFLFSLYRGNVESARMDIFISIFDQVLDEICDLIIDELRDQVVERVFQACMDGFIWILLDGGPSRAFLETDVDLMQQDLAMLKDLFIADGQGLPPDVVEKEAKLAQQILDLYALKADALVELLINASERMSCDVEVTTDATRYVHDAHTFLRVLCHKKDKVASSFLRNQYHLPRSSDYDDVPLKVPASKVPLLSDILKRSASLNLSETGQRSFRIMKKKLQEATRQ